MLRGGGWLGMAALAQALLQIVIFAVLARLLSPTEFGLVAVAGIFVDLAAGVAAMGASQALVQRRDLTRFHIRAAFWISMLMGLVATAVLYGLSGWLAAVLGNPASAPLIAALSFTFVIRALGSVSEGLAARRLLFRVLAVRQLAAYVLGYGVIGIGGAILGLGAWALVYAQLTQVGIATLLLIAVVRFDCRPTIAWSAYRDILGFGTGFSVARIANSLANQADRAIVSMNASAAAVGLYTRALQITRYPSTMVGHVIEDVLFPSFSGVQTDLDRLRGAYSRSVGSIFVALAPLTVFFCLTAGPIADVLLGSQWSGAASLMIAFGVVIPIRSAQRICSALLRAVGRSWLVAGLQVFLFAGTTVGAVIGIKFGLLGTAIGVTVAFALHYLASVIACKLALSLDGRQLLASHFAGLPLSLLVAIGAGTGMVASASDVIASPLALVISTITCVALTLAAVWFSPRFFLRPDGLWLSQLLFLKLPSKLSGQKLFKAFFRRMNK
ncbi:MAG: lipopolysaccharide biosynthesis protein [Mycobacterium sp.]